LRPVFIIWSSGVIVDKTSAALCSLIWGVTWWGVSVLRCMTTRADPSCFETRKHRNSAETCVVSPCWRRSSITWSVRGEIYEKQRRSSHKSVALWWKVSWNICYTSTKSFYVQGAYHHRLLTKALRHSGMCPLKSFSLHGLRAHAPAVMITYGILRIAGVWFIFHCLHV
jgi:hypothetical protein